MDKSKATNNEELIARLRRELPRFQRDFAVRSFGLFGSFVRDEQTPQSDIDLLVDFDVVPGLFGFFELQDALSTLLGRSVDLVTRDALKPAIGKRILSELRQI
jgi:predicted nucleotidyltransferase